jgi:hypothetical protein
LSDKGRVCIIENRRVQVSGGWGRRGSAKAGRTCNWKFWKGIAVMAFRRGQFAMVGLVAALGGMPAFAQLATRATVANPEPGLRASENARGAAWKLLAGYQLNHSFGLEAAYGDLGRYGYLSGMPGLSASGDVRMRAWSLAGTSNLPIGAQWSVTGKLGMGNNPADLLRFSNPAWAAAGAAGELALKARLAPARCPPPRLRCAACTADPRVISLERPLL